MRRDPKAPQADWLLWAPPQLEHELLLFVSIGAAGLCSINFWLLRRMRNRAPSFAFDAIAGLMVE